MSNINDDYWNCSSSSKFNFDDEEISSSQIDSVANDVYTLKQEETTFFTVELITSKECLDLILQDNAVQSPYMSLPIEETVEKLMMGQRYVLKDCRSLKRKTCLLDEALKTCDGDIIIEVVVFLRNTLKFNIFCDIIDKRKVALAQYSNFLKMKGDMLELEKLYMSTNLISTIRDLYFIPRRNSTSKEVNLNKLKSFLQAHSQNLNFRERNFFTDFMNFLEWQIRARQQADSVIAQLAIICRNQYEQNLSNDRLSEFKTWFKIDDAQFEWTIINCLSSMGSWKKLIEMFIKPNWFNKKNILKTSINNEMFIWGISRHNPPKNVLEQFLLCLNDSEKSLTLAKKFDCRKFVIEYYINQRDRKALLNCLEEIPMYSEEYYAIKKALSSSDRKWKN